MSLYFTSLNSGSNGNCYYLANDQDAVLVDAGICCRETEKRMARLGLSMSKVRAIFISHEHSDHIRGLAVISKKYQIPVYITEGTRVRGGLTIEPHLLRTFTQHQPVQVGDISITAFPKYHDACDPHSFIVTCCHVTVGVFTDIGCLCSDVIRYFTKCHAVFLEANYDEHMLNSGRYPYHLKRRITGGRGHLSNTQALELFTRNRSPRLSHVLLSHLSRDNNSPSLVLELFKNSSADTKFVVASRDRETEVYYLCKEDAAERSVPIIQPPLVQEYVQYSLFA